MCCRKSWSLELATRYSSGENQFFISEAFLLKGRENRGDNLSEHLGLSTDVQFWIDEGGKVPSLAMVTNGGEWLPMVAID